MRKLTLVVLLALIVSGCSPLSKASIERELNESWQESKNLAYVNDKGKYAIREINNLGEKYGEGRSTVYIDEYDSLSLSNIMIESYAFEEDYFNDMVEILEETLAPGLKEAIKEGIKSGKDQPISIRTGPVNVYVDSRYDQAEVILNINFLDVNNKVYQDLIAGFEDYNYYLDGFAQGKEFDRINLANKYSSQDIYYSRTRSLFGGVRIDLILDDDYIKKANVLISKDGDSYSEEDLKAFEHLLSVMDIKGESKDRLMEEYIKIFENKPSNLNLKLDGLDIRVVANKGNKNRSYGKTIEFIYFSIEN